MNANEIMTLGLGLTPPWQVVSSELDLESNPTELKLELSAGRGAEYPCPVCGTLCKAHDFKESRWQHLNFFQHKCTITANVPRVKCSEHGIHRINVPWAREGSGFTLLFEQVLLVLCREMPVAKVAEVTGVTDHRIWRVLSFYVQKALAKLDLSELHGIGVDETASKRGHNYVTIFVDMERETRPVIFATPGKGSETFVAFKEYLKAHSGSYRNITEVVCDMSPAFLSAANRELPFSDVTIDWFHVVQTFTRAVDNVRKLESREYNMPVGARWALVRAGETVQTQEQIAALEDLEKRGMETSKAYLIKEKLRWIRGAETKRAALWRATVFLQKARGILEGTRYMEPMRKALDTFERHREAIIARWESMLTNARLEGLNSLFQAARARARGYRNTMTFITMIYLIAAPIKELLFPV